jgi:putative tricarboxylic transport membrane protein
MDIWQNLMNGFGAALAPYNLMLALLGVVLGTITGILPGIGPMGAMALLLSFTLQLDATAAMILFAGIYYGAMYGGSTTSILLNIPGEAASVVTCIDGHKMAQKGRAGAALAVSAIGSFVAGGISILGLMLAAPVLGNAALKFGPPEFFAIGCFGLVLLVILDEGNTLQSLIMILLGMAISTVGSDYLTGKMRFTFGFEALDQGLDFLPVAVGVFGISEILATANQGGGGERIKNVPLKDLWPNRKEWQRSARPIVRGSFMGFLIGLIPGPSPVIATFVSYVTEKKLSKHPEEFGHGAIEGVAGPEAANNAAVGGAYVPLMALGIPFTPAMAMVLGALMLHNITPGPNMIQAKGDIFWAMIASMYIGNVMLVLLNLPLVNLFVRILYIPRQVLFPVVILLCFVGVYSVNSSVVDLLIMGIFGFVGYVLRGRGFPPAPLLLAMIIGPMMETSLRQALVISGGDVGVLFLKPICLSLYLVLLGAITTPWLVRKMRRKRTAPSQKETRAD